MGKRFIICLSAAALMCPAAAFAQSLRIAPAPQGALSVITPSAALTAGSLTITPTPSGALNVTIQPLQGPAVQESVHAVEIDATPQTQFLPYSATQLIEQSGPDDQRVLQSVVIAPPPPAREAAPDGGDDSECDEQEKQQHCHFNPSGDFVCECENP
ncbi:MAG: hypothetical protein AB1469_06775 [Pseudomonadota bacterium]